jgi:hypothetical protein
LLKRSTDSVSIAGVSTADDEVLDQLIATDLVDHDPVPGQAPGQAGFKYWVDVIHDAFPDTHGVVEDTVVEGDKVAARVTWRGMHHGVFVGIPEPARQSNSRPFTSSSSLLGRRASTTAASCQRSSAPRRSGRRRTAPGICSAASNLKGGASAMVETKPRFDVMAESIWAAREGREGADALKDLRASPMPGVGGGIGSAPGSSDLDRMADASELIAKQAVLFARDYQSGVYEPIRAAKAPAFQV